mmetsp:Transcript_7212/g.23802  ORF Transcript_7212/g.23802 Transcript_7212/m.23802 type:complete len:290 (+) Transcript_7212:297-1166(+)
MLARSNAGSSPLIASAACHHMTTRIALHAGMTKLSVDRKAMVSVRVVRAAMTATKPQAAGMASGSAAPLPRTISPGMSEPMKTAAQPSSDFSLISPRPRTLKRWRPNGVPIISPIASPYVSGSNTSWVESAHSFSASSCGGRPSSAMPKEATIPHIMLMEPIIAFCCPRRPSRILSAAPNKKDSQRHLARCSGPLKSQTAVAWIVMRSSDPRDTESTSAPRSETRRALKMMVDVSVTTWPPFRKRTSQILMRVLRRGSARSLGSQSAGRSSRVPLISSITSSLSPMRLR